jgi:hypothetical protein
VGAFFEGGNQQVAMIKQQNKTNKTPQNRHIDMAPTRAAQLARMDAPSTSGTSTKPGVRCKRCDKTKSGQCFKHRRREQEELSLVEDSVLAEARKRDREGNRAYVAEGKKYGYKREGYTRVRKRGPNHAVANPCKGPNGKTGTSCGKSRGDAYSGKGFAFCSSCFLNAYGVDAHNAAKAAIRHARNVGGPGRRDKCMGRGQGKVCPNLIVHKSGILGALIKTGMKDGRCRKLMRNDTIISLIVAEFNKARQCLPCFLEDHPDHAKTLENITSCDDGPCVGPACDSSLPRVPNSGGLCKPCFDALVERNAAECPAIECPAPPAKRPRR